MRWYLNLFMFDAFHTNEQQDGALRKLMRLIWENICCLKTRKIRKTQNGRSATLQTMLNVFVYSNTLQELSN